MILFQIGEEFFLEWRSPRVTKCAMGKYPKMYYFKAHSIAGRSWISDGIVAGFWLNGYIHLVKRFL